MISRIETTCNYIELQVEVSNQLQLTSRLCLAADSNPKSRATFNYTLASARPLSRVRQRIILRSPTTGSRRLGTILASVDVFHRRRWLVLRLELPFEVFARNSAQVLSFVVDDTGRARFRSSCKFHAQSFQESRALERAIRARARVASRIKTREESSRAARIQTGAAVKCACCYARLKVRLDFGEAR